MTKTPSNGKNKDYSLNTNEDFIIFLISKLITYFIDGFILGMKSQNCLFYQVVVQDIHWFLNLEGEVHSIWVM